MKNLIFIIGITYFTIACAIDDEFDPIDWSKVKSGHITRNPDEFSEIPDNQAQVRIVGGKISRPHQFPYQVELILKVLEGMTQCGGSLISKNYVLTAAHCVYGVFKGLVILGAHDLRNSNEPGQVRMRVFMSDFIMHSGYDDNVVRNDIALIKLPRSAPLSAKIQIISLPNKNIKTDYRSVVASGWGLMSDSGYGARYLRYVTLKTMTLQNCARYFRTLIRSTNICADSSSGKSTCEGDSGGPIVLEENGILTVVGLTSFGSSKGCEIGYPSVFTRISSYLDWIQNHSDIKI